jgi:hypothetical protein
MHCNSADNLTLKRRAKELQSGHHHQEIISKLVLTEPSIIRVIEVDGVLSSETGTVQSEVQELEP